MAFGVYDVGKPRSRIMLSSLRAQGVVIDEVHVDVWRGIEDKSQTGTADRVGLVFRWITAYPVLLWRYLFCTRRHSVVVVAYPGVLDILLLAPFAKLRGARIVFDVFVSLFDTMIVDRKLAGAGGWMSRLLFWSERAAYRRADRIVLDTGEHASYVRQLFDLPAERMRAVAVGCEGVHFPRLPPRRKKEGEAVRVLFYGQFIPLHGVDTIFEAARMARDSGDAIDWIVVGTGQDAPRMRLNLASDPVPRLSWIEWIEYPELTRQIELADIGLGIFGQGGKASRVIPNKAYQILASGRPLVTLDSPAIRELVQAGEPGIRLVPAGDATTLLSAVKELSRSGEYPSQDIAQRFSEQCIGETYVAILEEVAG